MTSARLPRTALAVLVPALAASSALAASWALWSSGGPGPSEHLSVHGRTVVLYGQGLYRHMSADVAVQGLAQDYVTLFVALPVLLVAWRRAIGGSLRARLVLAGTLGYFFLTYLFYLAMAFYNAMFLAYVVALGTAFFALTLTMLSFEVACLPAVIDPRVPARLIGGFTVSVAAAIGLLWLGVVVPPLADGTVVPEAIAHYTTLIVQGYDLALFLPIGITSGVLLYRRAPAGFLLGTVNLVFLSILMLALVAKLIAMAMAGASVMPAVVIIPVFWLGAVAGAVTLLGGVAPNA
ncbi:MAG: hypothetical protein Q8L86_04245 [Vicinamibacterales bacterium]|nr:hypothetical protein [Vicinamibacterales bacterium]